MDLLSPLLVPTCSTNFLQNVLPLPRQLSRTFSTLPASSNVLQPPRTCFSLLQLPPNKQLEMDEQSAYSEKRSSGRCSSINSFCFTIFPGGDPPGDPRSKKQLPGRRVVNSRKRTGKVAKRAVKKQELITYLESAW